MITVFWDYEGMILADAAAKKGDNQLQHLHQDADTALEAFQTSMASQETNRNLASA
jgi:hypothetical protein